MDLLSNELDIGSLFDVNVIDVASDTTLECISKTMEECFNDLDCLPPLCCNDQLEFSNFEQNTYFDSLGKTKDVTLNDLNYSNNSHIQIKSNAEQLITSPNSSKYINNKKPIIIKVIDKNTAGKMINNPNAKKILKLVPSPNNVTVPNKEVICVKNSSNESVKLATSAFNSNECLKSRNKESNDSDDSSEITYGMQSKSKNAIAARENRERKKKYLKDLEKSCADLSTENEKLKAEISTLCEDNANLQNEVKYLKSIIANSDDIGILIKGIKNIPGIKLNSSVKRKRENEVAESENFFDCKKQKLSNNSQDINKTENEQKNTGICLHVGSGKISFELCHHCNEMVEDRNNHSFK